MLEKQPARVPDSHITNAMAPLHKEMQEFMPDAAGNRWVMEDSGTRVTWHFDRSSEKSTYPTTRPGWIDLRLTQAFELQETAPEMPDTSRRATIELRMRLPPHGRIQSESFEIEGPLNGSTLAIDDTVREKPSEEGQEALLAALGFIQTLGGMAAARLTVITFGLWHPRHGEIITTSTTRIEPPGSSYPDSPPLSDIRTIVPPPIEADERVASSSSLEAQWYPVPGYYPGLHNLSGLRSSRSTDESGAKWQVWQYGDRIEPIDAALVERHRAAGIAILNAAKQHQSRPDNS